MARLTLPQQTWMQSPATRSMLAALGEFGSGDIARFVGGAVRNSLLDQPVQDIDIATILTPDMVLQKLQQAGLKAIPTGIEHGTITALSAGKIYEITSLRKDVTTDGRRATVSFTTDWREDAARRDFTINALYASADGALFDYHAGLQDIADAKLRFIGDPAARIKEDYLRILRLFRLHAAYGKGEMDPAALQAAIDAKSHIQSLSGERVSKEMLRLLAAEDPHPVLQIMAQTGILYEVILAPADLARLDQLIRIDRHNFFPPDEILRLAAMLQSEADAQMIAARFRLANKDRLRLRLAVQQHRALRSDIPLKDLRQALYQHGRDALRDRIRLNWAAEGEANTIAWRTVLAMAESWEKPAFPLSGHDGLALGLTPGPAMGQCLKQAEQAWIESDFTLDPATLKTYLKPA